MLTWRTIIIDSKHLCLDTTTLMSVAHDCCHNEQTKTKEGAPSDALSVSLCKPGHVWHDIQDVSGWNWYTNLLDVSDSAYLGVNTCMVSQCMSFSSGSTNPLVVAKMGPAASPECKVYPW
jgi:hypothetical protein